MSNTVTVTGLKVLTYQLKKSKEEEKLKITLEGTVEEITQDMGKVQKALLTHLTSENEVGFKLLIPDTSADVEDL